MPKKEAILFVSITWARGAKIKIFVMGLDPKLGPSSTRTSTNLVQRPSSQVWEKAHQGSYGSKINKAGTYDPDKPAFQENSESTRYGLSYPDTELI